MENKIAKNWLLLAVVSLALSGIFSILLIVGRTSNALDFLGIEEFFKVSLIIHVNLGILVWLLSMTACLFSKYRNDEFPYSFYGGVLAAILITVSGFTYSDGAYLNNYVPMFENLYFKIGIYLFLAVIFIESIGAVSLKNFGLKSTAIMYLVACITLAYALAELWEQETSHAFYESIFWGFGHVLQFVYTQIMLVCWLILGSFIGIKSMQSEKNNIFLYIPLLIIVLTTPLILFTNDINSGGYHYYFSQQMIWGAGLAAIPIGFLLFLGLFNAKTEHKAVRSSLWFSLALFIIGGVISAMAAKVMFIDGEITTLIPAHYHGATIAVTVAFMGMVYHLLSINTRLANTQIWLYSIGQILYIVGLAILGGHGAARKTPGTEGLEVHEAVIHLMRGGGALVLIGGFLFIWVVFRNISKSK